MDNENKLIIRIKSFLKKTYNKALFDCYKNIKDSQDSNAYLKNLLKETTPFLVSRIGATEGVTVQKWLAGKTLNHADIDRINHLSGVFPKDRNIIEKFCDVYLKSLKDVDHLGLFYSPAEGMLADKFCSKNTTFSELRGVEPFYHNDPWTKYLEDKRILVIHPFKESILSQYHRRDSLFSNGLLPKFKSLEVIQAVQTVAGQESEFKNWFEALDYMKSEIDKCQFDLAIIGAGAYGLPLGSHIKSSGRSAIHLGGSTQIMFGIKGKRWDTHEVISKLYNDNWKRPNESEAPNQKSLVEGGTYW